mgnify:FL=1
MISKHIFGRLGNQMFQYAAIRAFQEKYRKNEELLLDFSEVYKMGFKEELSNFNVKPFKTGKMKLNTSQKLALLKLNIIKFYYLKKDPQNYAKKMYVIEKKLQPKMNKKGLYSFRLGYYDFKDCKCKNCCFFGTFESAKYFDEIKDIIKQEFTPKYGILEHNKELYKEIEKTESVCVTIRRGDFVSVPEYKKDLYVCTPDYFERAIKLMQEKVPKAKFFVFSDDVEWCKNNMKFPKGTMYESGTDPVWEKLRMMYSCKHFIISNSTFSYWAQYLSRNDKKVVIAPKRWGNNLYKNEDKLIDIYQDNWTLIDN